MSHEEKGKGMKVEAITASLLTTEDRWFEFSSVTMNKTLSPLTLGSMWNIFGCILAEVEAFGLANLA